MKHYLIFLAFTFFLVPSSIYSQNNESIFDYLSGKDVVEITVAANFDSVITNKYDTSYWAATLQLKEDEHIWDIKIKTRGRYRRKICDFPPIKLEFSKSDLSDKGLSRYDDLKLVTHCLDDDLSDDYVLREAMAYGLYEILSPQKSFRHQLVKVTYVNTGKKRYKMKRYGILIENEKDLAARIKGVPIDTFGLKWENIELQSMELSASYQYMIGNTDWSIPMQRNLKFIQTDSKEQYITVPYDFDMSGLVNPTYGIPNPDFPVATLQDRYYLGAQRPSPKTIALLESKKDELLDYCKNFKLLRGVHRVEVRKFIASFYEELESGRAFINEQEEEKAEEKK